MYTYSDILLNIKRGFLIVGLTGYTGSGCTTVMQLLEKKEAPLFPGLSSIEDNIDPKVYAKLEWTWKSLTWSRFVSIEVSKVIFMFAIHKAIHTDSRSELLENIYNIVQPHEEAFQGLYLMLTDEPELKDINNAKSFINGYNKAKRLFGTFKKHCSKDLYSFINLMQELGDQIRQFGQVKDNKSYHPRPENMLVLPEAIRRLIKAYRVAFGETRFVIDAFRNPYEVEYFKRRYSEFYLIAVQRPLDDIRKALENLSGDQINEIQNRERGGKVENKSSKNIHEWITSQNIEECLQKADLFINNVYDKSYTYPHLRYYLLRLIILTNIPGIVPPNSDERNMQIAMTARQNSGCLSRHVGAVVLSRKGFILGFGWNDPPQGQVQCTLRTAEDLLRDMDAEMFSEYERSFDFVTHMRNKINKHNPFCFKDEYKEIKSKSVNEFTRSLHAEENAMLQATANAGAEGIDGSTIFTTDSPCTLCSKKAYQLGVSRIVYIEEYPGIAIQQTLCTGKRNVSLEQFQGITGSAYFRLFTSLMNEKDFLKLDKAQG